MSPVEGGVPTGPGWGFEFDLDVLRVIAYLGSGGLRLLSASSERPITAGYPELSSLTATGRRYVLDGKIVALDGQGLPSTAALRRRTGVARPSPALLRAVPVRYHVTDLLALDDRVTLGLPHRRRRELLGELDLAGPPAELSPWFPDADGAVMLSPVDRPAAGTSDRRAVRRSHRRCPGSRRMPPTSRAWPCRWPGPSCGRCAHRSRRTSCTTRSPRSRPSCAPTRHGPVTCSRSSPTTPATASGRRPARFRSVPSWPTCAATWRWNGRASVIGCGVVEEVDDGVRGVVVPPLTVRPLVEHAVRNAIEPAPTGGSLRISAVAVGGGCLITVAEDAGGADGGRLREVVADVRARLRAAGHPEPPHVLVGEGGMSVTVRVAR